MIGVNIVKITLYEQIYVKYLLPSTWHFPRSSTKHKILEHVHFVSFIHCGRWPNAGCPFSPITNEGYLSLPHQSKSTNLTLPSLQVMEKVKNASIRICLLHLLASRGSCSIVEKSWCKIAVASWRAADGPLHDTSMQTSRRPFCMIVFVLHDAVWHS